MNLKIRYATSLLLVLILLGLFTWTIVLTLTQHHYLLALILAVILYLATFQLGKRLSQVFFTLSFLQHMKKCNGVVRRDACGTFIAKSIGKRRSAQEIDTLTESILSTLQKENIIVIQDDRIVLVSP